MPKIRVAPPALKDLQSIKAYICEELCNPQAAASVVGKIVKAYTLLETMPTMGTPLSSIIPIQTDYRFLVSGNYLVFYKADREYVSIYRILYGKRDYLSVLFGETSEPEI